MVYNIIGLMSGSSLDGMDIAFVELTEIGGQWTYELKNAECIDYDSEWIRRLKEASNSSVTDLAILHTQYGHWIGNNVKHFIERNNLDHKIHLIVSHGHTVLHLPELQTTLQIGDGAAIAAITGISCVSHLRNKDMALGGQGAPIVPIAENLLWKDASVFLNLGGIANISIHLKEEIQAFDITVCNQLLNYFANKEGLEYDNQGILASSGKVDYDVLVKMNNLSYFQIKGPKSLDNGFLNEVMEVFDGIESNDALATACEHIALQIKNNLNFTDYSSIENKQIFITGGGAFNEYLIERIKAHLPNYVIMIPDENTVKYKEAIAMALIGALRWREEENVLCSVTGATQNSVGGALWVN